MIRIISIFMTLAATFFFSGCSTVSETDSLLIDWYDLGRTDGMSGKSRSAFQQQAKYFIEQGVVPDHELYYEGHDEGLSIYCTEQYGFDLGKKGLPYNSVCPDESDFKIAYNKGISLYCTEENGYLMGLNGRPYNYVCSPQLEIDFLRGYEKGQKIFGYKTRIKTLERRLAQINYQKSNKEAKLSPDLSDEKKMHLRSELGLLDTKYRDAIRDLEQTIRDLQDYEDSIRGSDL